MGPNLYITPPGSFTDFHQDGHGTVDSGHQCLSGYNEVVMLRRMPEAHKQNAMNILNGNNPASCYDALYGLPHREGAVSLSWKVSGILTRTSLLRCSSYLLSCSFVAYFWCFISHPKPHVGQVKPTLINVWR
jgi:hypothetical protein